MSYKQFRQDLDNIELFKTYKAFLDKVKTSLSTPLSTDINFLENQLIEAQSFQARLVHIYAAAKSLKNKAYDAAWSKKGPVKHGEAARMQAEVDAEIKEYDYLVTFLEKIIDVVSDRINLGKKLLGDK